MTLYRLRSTRVRFADGSTVPLPDLDVAPGERVGVLGPNGSGKTTLLRVLAFLERPEAEVTAAIAPRDVAFVAQRPYLFRGSVAANVALAVHEHRERAARVMEALDRVGASHLAGRRRGALSAGELQRVAIARALVARPRVLLLDEPLGPLDADGASRLRTVLAELAGVTVVVAAPGRDGIPFADGCRTVALGG